MDSTDGTVRQGTPRILEVGKSHMYCGPGGLVEAMDLTNRKVHLKGIGKGVAKLILDQELKILNKSGKEAWCHGRALYVIVVKEAEMAPQVTADIPRVVIFGKAVKKWDQVPVTGARVSLVIQSGPHKGGGYEDPSWITDAQGQFTIEARNLPSAHYEILVQKLRTEASSGSLAASGSSGDRFDMGEIGIENDLWPSDQYLILLTKDIADNGPMDAGIILMDEVRNVFPTSSQRNRIPIYIKPGSNSQGSSPGNSGYIPVVTSP